ncbi:MAG: CoA transferase [Chloroflexi bacterium]|nr:CoA transferase [Chloroflexota bacterium]
MRILDLTQVYAGPYATRLLADLGAEVLRIEAPMRAGHGPVGRLPAGLDIMYPQREPGEQPYNRFAYYNELNRNKMAMSLDLSTETGRGVFRRLVAVSDVVMENFSPRVMPNFGLDYPELRKLRPDLLMVSLPALGLTGPYRDYVAYGTGLEGMVGLATMTGYPNGPPLKTGIAYGDPVGGLHAAFGTLAALRHRRLTGQGQHIEVALRESLTMTMGQAIMDYAMNGRVGRRQGNRHEAWVPHGAYPCQGEDEWVAIAVRSDSEWRSLRQAMGDPEWARDDRFAGALGRHQHQAEIDEHLGRWTRGFDHYGLMRRLQDAGVPAAAVLNIREMATDPHYVARGFFRSVEHRAAGGAHLYPGVPWKMGQTPGAVRRPPPDFGEHNRWALAELLGLPEAEVSELERRGVTATVPAA